jgi:putative membrane protein
MIFSVPFFHIRNISPVTLGREYGWGHGPGMMDWGFGMGWLGLVMMGVFWVLVIAAIILLIRWRVTSGSSRGRDSTAGDSALEILKKRYARGEINREEFEEKKRDLS